MRFGKLSTILTVSLLAIWVIPSAFAQIEEKGVPVSFGITTRAVLQPVSMPPIDIPALLVEDSIQEEQGYPFRFGYGYDVHYDLDNSGSWEDLSDGSRLWRFRIECPGAFSINLIYDDFWLPKGARLFVYNEDRSMVIGAFTEENNKEYRQFATRPVKGDVTILEYHEPADVEQPGIISIQRVVHGYKDIFHWSTVKDFLRNYGDAGTCNNNVNCPEGDPWHNEKRSVAMIQLAGGTRWCSGSLVNNEPGADRQYFLTAEHCGTGFGTWIFMFNYQSPTCINEDGPTYMTVSGSTNRAVNANSDVRLVEIDEAIPPLYRVYYAGWNALNQTQTSATGIHHPRGDIKKISFSTSGTTTADYLGSSGSGTSHWRIVWTDGTTEGGSSGSPLFDPNRRIVGQLHGGWASCTQMSQPDYYGKFSQSMDFGTSSANRLREWLDPDATGTDLLDGRDGYDLEAAVLLIDRTGSMSLLTADGRTRFEVAIEYARQDAEEIYENHPGVSVLVGHFETDNVIVAGQPWRTDLTNVLADITAVEALGTGNMTPLADAISEAADVLAGASTPGFGNLYIYTDGNENYSEIGSSEYTVTGPCYSDLINFPDDPADVIAGTGTGIDWDYGCDPGDPGSNCGDYQECVADELIAEGIIYARYFGLPILKSGTDPEDESRTPMDALATDASGLDGGTGRDSEGLKFFRYLAEASGGEFQFVSDVNQPPIASCQDVTVYADADCLAWASIDNGSYDPDGDPIMIVQVPTGPYPLGQTLVTLTVSDNFLLSSSCQATVTVVDTTSPVCIPPDDATIFLCTPTEICLPVACTDNCDPNSTITVVGGPGEIVGNQSWCYTPPGNGTYDVTMRCTDSSGNSCDAEFSVTIWMAQLAIEKTHNTFQGQFVDVSITIVGLNLPMGGFDVLVAYDASALGLQSATPGPPFYDPAPDGCGWEYFTYRFGPFGNCGDACPSGMVRIFGLAETNNGPNHPSCYGVPDSDPHELATMTFLVTNDRTFECQYVPIWFFWGDCGDNTISSQDGGVLYLDRLIHDYDGRLIWDEDDDDQFPEDERIPYVGAPDYCLNPDPNKPSPFRLTCFVNGGVDIVCADSIDARGDINLNGVPNEVADAVLFGRWFVIGGGCWPIGPPVEAYIAATDVNADGITLSVADFVYLVRIITGDALPYPKLSPVTADADLVNGVLSVNTDMGAAYVVVENSITPRLLAESMEMKYQYDVDNNLTRILVFSLEKDRRFSGDFLGGVEGNVMILEMATYDGTPVTTKLVPDEFALYPSYPNPFNPVATISFALAQPVDYELVIYNSLGQMVKTFSGHSGPGFERLDWNASGFASGVYFYRLTAGDFTDTRKMVLLK